MKAIEFLEEAYSKKVFHKSTAPLAAGVKQEILTQACNSDVTQIRPHETHQSQFARRKRGISSSRRNEHCYMKFFPFPLTWENRASILAHEEDRETRFSRRKSPIRIARPVMQDGS
jgi:hypothetical protein